MLKRAAFLDRDGVLNINHGHVHTKEQFEWVPGALEAIETLNSMGYETIIVTNQAGIAKGFYTEEQFHEFMRWVLAQCEEAGVTIHAYYYCPHHPSEGFPPYVQDCECRKPKPGMLNRAVSERGIDPATSIFIGDKQSDMDAAAAAGVRGLLFNEANLNEFVKARLA